MNTPSALVILLLFITVSTLVVFIRKHHTTNKKLKRTEVKLIISKAELISSNYQTHPDFINNAITSAKVLALNAREESLNYLTLLSRFNRRVVEYSDEKFIRLEDEIEFLEMYLGLEEVRFSGQLRFLFKVESDLNQSIPSLLILPYLEKVLYDRLQYSDAPRLIHIHFKNRETHIECRITSRGVDIKAAAHTCQKLNLNSLQKQMHKVEQRYTHYQYEFGEYIGFPTSEEYDNSASLMMNLPVAEKCRA